MPQTYTGQDLGRAFRTVRKNTIRIAEDIPENQYGFRPAPGVRSVAETLAHIAVGNTLAGSGTSGGPTDVHRFRVLRRIDGPGRPGRSGAHR